MTRIPTAALFLLLASLSLTAACGERADAEPEPEVVPAGPPARDSMSASSLSGIAPEEIALVLPWSAGRLNRESEPGQSQRTIDEILLLSGDGFDRFIVTFLDDAPFLPGYRVQFVDTVPECPQGGVSFAPRGSALLEFHITAARSQRDDGSTAIPRRSLRGVSDDVLGLHNTCDHQGGVTWVFDLAGPTSYRLLELVNPTRLVVDVQRPAGDTTEP